MIFRCKYKKHSIEILILEFLLVGTYNIVMDLLVLNQLYFIVELFNIIHIFSGQQDYWK